jgi:hypothetical protein
MPELNRNDAIPRKIGELNRTQQTRLRISCQYIDKLLSDIEEILHQATSQSPFPRHIVDVSPAQVRMLEDYIRRHACPVKSRTESTGWRRGVSHVGSRSAEVPVKWGFSRTESC